jgi:hypothetical protein
MEAIRNYIREQIIKTMEQNDKTFVPIPYHVQPILKNIGLFPFDRYVSEVKHANTVPPSEEINLINGNKFFIYFGEDKEIEIGGEKFFLSDKRNHYLIRDKVNDLLTQGKISTDSPDEEPTDEEPTDEPTEESDEES